jgi:hypothetical protein
MSWKECPVCAGLGLIEDSRPAPPPRADGVAERASPVRAEEREQEED